MSGSVAVRKTRAGGIDDLFWQVLTFGLLMFGLVIWYGPSIFKSSAAIGHKMEPWQVQPLTGTTYGFSSEEAAGQVVLLNFWGTWCGPCRMELPHIAALYRRFSKIPNVAIIAVSCGGGGDRDLEALRKNTQDYLKQSGNRLPTYADRGGAARKCVPGMRGYPCTVVLDGDGVIRGMWSGYRPGCETEMEKLITDLLCSGAKNHWQLAAAP